MTHFIFKVLRPTLTEMSMWSPSAEKLLTMIAAHESLGLKHRVQVQGPALGVFQMEPATFKDLLQTYLGQVNPGRRERLARFLPDEPEDLAEAFEDLAEGRAEIHPGLLDALRDNDPFACAAARLQLARVAEPLPDVEDNEGLAHYAKAHWNSVLGKAKADKYLSDFVRYRPDVRPIEWGQS